MTVCDFFGEHGTTCPVVNGVSQPRAVWEQLQQ